MEELEEKYEARIQLNKVIYDEDILWLQRANKLWKQHGDRCSKLSHHVVNASISSNSIHSLIIEDKACEEPGKIKNHIRDYFANLYKEKTSSRPFFEDHVLKTLSTEQVVQLDKDFSKAEIFYA